VIRLLAVLALLPTIALGIKPTFKPFNVAAGVGGGGGGMCPDPLQYVKTQAVGATITDSSTLVSMSFTVDGSSCPDRMMFVTMARNNVYSGSNSPAVQSLTWGTTPLIFEFSEGGTTPIDCGPSSACARMELWSLKNPPSDTRTLTAVFLETDGVGGAGAIIAAWQFNGVDQVTPFGTHAVNQSQAEQHSVNCTGGISDFYIGWLHARHNHDRTEPGGDQVNQFGVVHIGPASTDRHASSKGATQIPGRLSATFAWNNSGNNQDESKTICLPIQAAQ